MNEIMQDRFTSDQSQYKMEVLAALSLMIVKNTENLDMEYVEIGSKPKALLPKDFPKYADHITLSMKEPIPTGKVRPMENAGELMQPTIQVSDVTPLPETLEEFNDPNQKDLRYKLDNSLDTVTKDILEDPENIPRVLGTAGGLEAIVGSELAGQKIPYDTENGKKKSLPLSRFLKDKPRDMEEDKYEKARAELLQKLKQRIEEMSEAGEGYKERLYQGIKTKLNAMLPAVDDRIAYVRWKSRVKLERSKKTGELKPGGEDRTYVMRGDGLNKVGKYSEYLEEIRAEASEELEAAITAIWEASSDLIYSEKYDLEMFRKDAETQAQLMNMLGTD